MTSGVYTIYTSDIDNIRESLGDKADTFLLTLADLADEGTILFRNI